MNRIKIIRTWFRIPLLLSNSSNYQLFYCKLFLSISSAYSNLRCSSLHLLANGYQSNRVSYPFLFAVRYRGQDCSASARQPFVSSKSKLTPQPIEPSKPFRFPQLLLWFLAGASCGWFLKQKLGNDDDLKPEVIQPPKQPPVPSPPLEQSPNPGSPSKAIPDIPFSRSAQLNILADIAEAVMPSVVFIESDSTKYFIYICIHINKKCIVVGPFL